MNTLTLSIRTHITAMVMAALMLVGMIAFAPQAQASSFGNAVSLMNKLEDQISSYRSKNFAATPQVRGESTSVAEMQALIAELMERVADLQARLEAVQGNGLANNNLEIGDPVWTTYALNVRSNPGGKIVGQAVVGDTGVVTAGPESNNGYTWWYVEYDSGLSGWSAVNWLRELPGSRAEDGDIGYDAYILRVDGTCDQVGNLCIELGLDNDIFTVDVNDIEANSINDGFAANFKFEMDITANAGDLHIHEDSFQVSASIGEKADYMYDEDVVSNVDIDTTADNDSNYYVVKKGTTEKFEIELFYDPVVETRYMATLYGFDFRLESSDLYTVDFFPDRPATEFIEISGLDYTDWLNQVEDEESEAEEVVYTDDYEVTQVDETLTAGELGHPGYMIFSPGESKRTLAFNEIAIIGGPNVLPWNQFKTLIFKANGDEFKRVYLNEKIDWEYVSTKHGEGYVASIGDDNDLDIAAAQKRVDVTLKPEDDATNKTWTIFFPEGGIVADESSRGLINLGDEDEVFTFKVAK